MRIHISSSSEREGTGAISRVVFRKLVILGDIQCGKTTLFHSFNNGKKPSCNKSSSESPTQSFAGVSPTDQPRDVYYNIDIPGPPTRLYLLETDPFSAHGTDEFLVDHIFKDAHVVLLAFAINLPASLFNASTKWHRQARDQYGPDVPILLVGCKSDLRSTRSCVVTEEEAQVAAGYIGASYLECSALLREGVDEIFEAAVRAGFRETLEQGCGVC